MRILLINKFLYPKGGSETYLFQLGEYLKSQGHKVQYFGMDHEERCVGNRVGAYTKTIDFHQVSILDQVKFSFRTIYSSEARKKLRLVLEDFKPDVCHLNNFNYQLTPSIILEIVKWRSREGRACKIFYTAHDYQLLCPNHMFRNPNTGKLCERCMGGRFFNCLLGRCIHGSAPRSFLGAMEGYFWRWRQVYRYLDTIICCSEFMKSRMDQNPLFAPKTVLLRNFVAYEEKMGGHKWEKGDYVLYFGRYSEEKGINILVEASRQLPDILFIFAGDGPLKPLLASSPNIRDVGFKTGEELSELIGKARFSIYPSIWYENGPFSVMESQLYGTPVLGAEIGGIPELIRKGECGELFRSGDLEDLVKKIGDLWRDKERLETYTINCRDIHFDTVSQYCEKLMKLYRMEKRRKGCGKKS